MFVNDFYEFVQFELKKSQQGNITPSEFDMAYAAASNTLFCERYGLPQDYQHGKADPKIAYEVSQKIEDDMAPFLNLITLFIDKNGKAPRPSDYSHYVVVAKDVKLFNQYCGADSSLNYLPTSIDVVTASQLPQRRASQVLPPTLIDPICKFYSNYIQFYPTNLKTADLVYLANPVNAHWGFTTPNGRTPQFDPTTSIEVPWPVDCHFDLKNRILQFCAINLERQDITAITQKFKDDGQ